MVYSWYTGTFFFLVSYYLLAWCTNLTLRNTNKQTGISSRIWSQECENRVPSISRTVGREMNMTMMLNNKDKKRMVFKKNTLIIKVTCSPCNSADSETTILLPGKWLRAVFLWGCCNWWCIFQLVGEANTAAFIAIAFITCDRYVIAWCGHKIPIIKNLTWYVHWLAT